MYLFNKKKIENNFKINLKLMKNKDTKMDQNI